MSSSSPAESTSDQWHRRPVLSAAIRAVALSCPLVAAIGAGLIAGWSIAGDSVGAVIARLAAGAAASIVAFVVVERLARRCLPLAALFRLSLVFPDQAPSRFSVALRSTSVRKLQQWAKESRGDDEIPALAEKVVTLASALNFHDRRTRGHSERSRAMADLIADELRLAPAEANEVRWGAFLHDIGKLVVSADILNKPGQLTKKEWAVLEQHPAEGARLVEPLRPFLGSGVDAVGEHHEHFDGSGYPLQLSGKEISLAARIVTVADSFEVMTAVRSYKRPMSAQAARAELVKHSGTQFDPRVVRAFLNVPLGRLHWALGIAAWAAELPFLTVIPRAAAQASAFAGSGTVLSTSALSSIATASLGAFVAAGPATVHAAASTTSSPPAVSVASSMRSDPSTVGSQSVVATAPADPAQSSQLTQPTGTGSATDAGSPNEQTTSADAGGGSPTGSSVGSVATVGTGTVSAKPPANSNAGGSATVGVGLNAGGNSNGSGNSNAGGNSGSSNAGGSSKSNGGSDDEGSSDDDEGSSNDDGNSNAGGKGKGVGTTTTTTTAP